MNILRTALALSCVLVSASASAWTPRRTEPTAGANLIAYQVVIGSTMKRSGDADELFAHDPPAREALKARVEELIFKALQARGIAAEPDSLETKATAHFAVGVYGHKSSAGGCDVYLHYVTAHGVRRREDGEFEDTWEWNGLDSAGAEKLASSILESVQIALDDYLADLPLKN
jgi:hypothetical protein